MSAIVAVLVVLLGLAAAVVAWTYYRRRRGIAARRRVHLKLLASRDPILDFGISREHAATLADFDVSALHELIVRKRVTAETLVRAACMRARWAGDVHAAVADECFLDALLVAARLDRLPPSKRGPLHGIPITVKDGINVAGMDSTIGQLHGTFAPTRTSAGIVKALESAGAIVICKSNQSALPLSPYSSSNAIYGTTTNPWKPETTIAAGGSSGGAACLAAVRAGWIHVASDPGGLLRSAAHFCGVCDFAPTLPPGGREGLGAQKGLLPMTAGFMARTVSDLRKVCNAIAAFPRVAHKSDHIPTASERSERASTLTIGVLRSDGWFEPHPAVSRAIDETASNLSALGYVVVDFELPFLPEKFVPLVAALITYDEWGFLEAVSQTSDADSSTGTLWEHVAAAEGSHVTRRTHVGYMGIVSGLANLPPFLRRALVWFMRRGLRQERCALIMQGASEGLGSCPTQLLAVRAELAEQLELAMSEAGVDAVIMPPAGIPAGAARSRYNHSLLPAFMYSALCSIVGFPSGGVPVTHVRSSDLMWQRPPTDVYDTRVRMATAKSEGLPVSCGVFACPFRDDICLEIMHEIEEVSKFQHEPRSLQSFLSTWPGPQREAKKPQETSPLLASEDQDWTQEFTSTVARRLRRVLRIPSIGGQQDLWSLGTV